jgi:phospholipid transport system substrate-binding protein
MVFDWPKFARFSPPVRGSQAALRGSGRALGDDRWSGLGRAGAGSGAGAGKNAINEAIVVFSNKQLTPDEREKQLREIAARHFDFASMARSAVGYHWRSFTPEQRAQFVPLFTNFIEDVYLSRIESYSVEKVQQDIKSSTIQYNNQRIDSPDYAQVFTTVTLQDRKSPLQVNYMLHRNNGEWKIYDLSVDAISVIANYRNQFNRVLNNDGYDKLISIMTQKAQGLSSTFQK